MPRDQRRQCLILRPADDDIRSSDGPAEVVPTSLDGRPVPLTDAEGAKYVIHLHYQTQGKGKKKSKSKTIDWRLYHCIGELGAGSNSTAAFETAIDSLETALAYIGAPRLALPFAGGSDAELT